MDHSNEINHNIRIVIIAYIFTTFGNHNQFFLKSIKFSQCQQTFRTILTATNRNISQNMKL